MRNFAASTGVLFFFLGIRYPLYAVAGAAALAPLYILRISLFSIPFTIGEIAALGALAGITARYILANALATRITLLFRAVRPIQYPLLLLTAGLVFTTLFSSSLRTSLGVIKGWVLIPLLFSSTILLSHLSTRVIVRGLVYGGAVLALGTLLYALQGEFTYDRRLRAWYDSPNELALYLTPLTALALGLWRVERERVYIYGAAGALLVMTIAVILTRSRGALIGYGAALLVFWGVTVMRRHQATILRAAFITAGIGSILLPLVALTSFATTYRERASTSLSARLYIWDTALRIAAAHPFTGIGPGTFQNEYTHAAPREALARSPSVPQPHNLPLAFFLQTGAAGFIGMAWLTGRIVRKKITTHTWWLTLPLLVLLVHGAFDTPYWKNDLAMQFWIFAALLLKDN